MLDESLKESNLWRSIRKYFVDNLQESKGILTYFDRITSSADNPSADQWVNILLEAPRPGHVSDAFLTLFMFSRKDKEGVELAELRDTVMELLYPGYIDLYDASWTKAGALKVFVDDQSNRTYNESRTKMTYIQCTLKWAAVWS